MNISSASSSNSVSYSSSSSSSNSTAELEKQKSKLEDELKTVQLSDEADDTKQQKVQLLQQQIKMIEAQIAKKKAERTQTVSQGGAAAPATTNPLAAANSQDIANATVDSYGRFDIRV